MNKYLTTKECKVMKLLILASQIRREFSAEEVLAEYELDQKDLPARYAMSAMIKCLEKLSLRLAANGLPTFQRTTGVGRGAKARYRFDDGFVTRSIELVEHQKEPANVH